MSAVPLGLCTCGCGELTSIAAENNSRFGHVRGLPVRYIRGHGARRPKPNPPTRLCECGCGLYTNVIPGNRPNSVRGERFRYRKGHHTNSDPYLKVAAGPNCCWLWTGARDRLGYGLMQISKPRPTSRVAHRWFYEKEIGPIPEGLELDHLCRNRGCVNPRHLEPVTHIENIRRSREGGPA